MLFPSCLLFSASHIFAFSRCFIENRVSYLLPSSSIFYLGWQKKTIVREKVKGKELETKGTLWLGLTHYRHFGFANQLIDVMKYYSLLKKFKCRCQTKIREFLTNLRRFYLYFYQRKVPTFGYSSRGFPINNAKWQSRAAVSKLYYAIVHPENY